CSTTAPARTASIRSTARSWLTCSGCRAEAMTGTENWRIDHSGIGVSDMARSMRFYDAALGALGMRAVLRITPERGAATAVDAALGGIGYGEAYPVFWIDIFHPHGVRQHTAFRAISRAEVDAFHAAAI